MDPRIAIKEAIDVMHGGDERRAVHSVCIHSGASPIGSGQMPPVFKSIVEEYWRRRVGPASASVDCGAARCQCDDIEDQWYTLGERMRFVGGALYGSAASLTYYIVSVAILLTRAEAKSRMADLRSAMRAGGTRGAAFMWLLASHGVTDVPAHARMALKACVDNRRPGETPQNVSDTLVEMWSPSERLVRLVLECAGIVDSVAKGRWIHKSRDGDGSVVRRSYAFAPRIRYVDPLISLRTVLSSAGSNAPKMAEAISEAPGGDAPADPPSTPPEGGEGANPRAYKIEIGLTDARR